MRVELAADGIRLVEGEMATYVIADHSSHCGVCVYASEHGSWPTDHRGTHCKDCHRSWVGKAESHCTVCHRHFGSEAAGDAHRPGRISKDNCEDPTGFTRFETPRGPIWGGTDPEHMMAMVDARQKPRKPPSHVAETAVRVAS